VARAGGVTSAISAPTGGLVAGNSGWMSLAHGRRTEALAIAEPLAMVAALGERALGSADGSRGLAALRLRELLDDASQYARRKSGYERNQTRAFATSRLDLEALVPVVRGQRPLVVRANKSTDIRAALRLARDFRLRLVIEGGVEAWMVADELAAARVPVMLDPVDNLPHSFDRVQVRGDAAALLAGAGVQVGLSTLGSATSVRTLRQLAGNAVANGLPWDEALAAVTSVPAEVYRNAQRGTLARGKVADLVVWTGDPFELSSRAERVFIGGAEQPLTSRQDGLRARYQPPGPARPAGEASQPAAGAAH
jgi:imidazolonepropionase-like amidohydrolase